MKDMTKKLYLISKYEALHSTYTCTSGTWNMIKKRKNIGGSKDRILVRENWMLPHGQEEVYIYFVENIECYHKYEEV